MSIEHSQNPNDKTSVEIVEISEELMSYHRTKKQIKEHYDVEKQLAFELRQATKEERRSLYSSLYDELYRKVPHHPQLTRKKSLSETLEVTAAQMQFLHPFLAEDLTFLEIGPGDCSLSYEVAKVAKQVFAVDVSDEITKSIQTPSNFQLILSDGSSIPITPGSVNVAYSNQLMEHLHPEDAFEQLQNIFDTLAIGGVYICITPNRLTGPHDISKHFDSVATGFHLKEYTNAELRSLFRKAGFSNVAVYLNVRGLYIRFPVFIFAIIERIPSFFSARFRFRITRNKLYRGLLNCCFVGTK